MIQGLGIRLLRDRWEGLDSHHVTQIYQPKRKAWLYSYWNVSVRQVAEDKYWQDSNWEFNVTYLYITFLQRTASILKRWVSINFSSLHSYLGLRLYLVKVFLSNYDITLGWTFDHFITAMEMIWWYLNVKFSENNDGKLTSFVIAAWNNGEKNKWPGVLSNLAHRASSDQLHARGPDFKS